MRSPDRRLIPAITLFATLLLTASYSTAAAELPVEGIVERLAPSYVGHILFERVESPAGKDCFELATAADGKILIRGNSSISMAVGLNHYFKYFCKTSVSWFADQPVQLPDTPPPVACTIRKEARIQKRFFLNYCTYGYTMPWWQWRDWERLVDWMALNGINMPLAITGQEAVWHKVWMDFGLSDEEIRAYFTGPAHLPWHRMSNIDGWQGPLPRSWLDHQLALQKQILARVRELGMTPVLPAFNGHVPGALKKAFPAAKISELENWAKIDGQHICYLLDPLDTLFKKIQKAFLEEQTRQFGTDHVYGVDPLNEVKPPSWEPDYLARLSKTIYESLAETDPQAEWLQMGWLFHYDREHWTNDRIEAFLKGVPQGRMTLLDYFCENTEVWKLTESFFGQPFIWCHLGNFGGNSILCGNIEESSARFENALQNGDGNLAGIGSTLEALDVNPLVYEHVFERVWDSGATDPTTWFEQWADRRCGGEDGNARAAWRLLMETIYSSVPTLAGITLTNVRPCLTGRDNLPYSNADLFRAWELLLKAERQTRDSYQYDVVNVGRQVLGNHFLELRNRFAAHCKNGDLDALKTTGAKMNELMEDLDKLLATRASFLLGKWIGDARAFGEAEAEADYYEQNARTIITTWYKPDHLLNDYANRNWAGLTRDFYGKRWGMFIHDVIESAGNNQPFDEKAFHGKVIAFEGQWIEETKKFSARPTGDAIALARQLMEKYRDEIQGISIIP